VGKFPTDNPERGMMDKDIQIELVKSLLGLPTAVILAFFLISIYRDFRTLVSVLAKFFNTEFSAWFALFRAMFAKSYDNEQDDKPGE